MIGFVLLISSLTLFGGAIAWRLGRSPAASGVAPLQASRDQDLLPESGTGTGNGLAAFYAYQMAAGKIHDLR
jgi:hypothetical protein